MTRGAKRDDSPILQKILDRLLSIDPPIKRLAVEPPDPATAIFLLALCDVCYITTRSDAGREETALMTSDGKIYYTTLGLGEVAKKLAEHPHFMQTSKFYIVNLTKIRGVKMSNARDLLFEGLEKPLVNAVTETYRDEFDRRVALS